MPEDLKDRCIKLVETLNIASAGEVTAVVPLTGGVASDIARVELGQRVICVKFALKKLRVAEDWYAPVSRNAAEYRWLRFAGDAAPGSVPALLGRDNEKNGFAMEFLGGTSTYLWKDALLREQYSRGEASLVGRALGRIHAASTAMGFARDNFENRADFYQLRLEPYLVFTATRHPQIKEPVNKLVRSLQQNLKVLIHGDVSPKNIMIHKGKPVLLDAECATMGDPAFDLAFCLNHLALKSVHLPRRCRHLRETMLELWNAYAEHINWEDRQAVEQRLCALLPVLMLARVDGKSPVEYLNDYNRDRVRLFSLSMVSKPTSRLKAFISTLAAAFNE